MELLAAALSDRYRIEREWAGDGIPAVYPAEDPKDQRQLAVDVFSPAIAGVLGAERFHHETRIARVLAGTARRS